MRVLVLGASGLIGGHIAASLAARSHHIVAGGRNIGAARRRLPHFHWVEADFNRDCDEAGWRERLTGVDAVVNCVGVLQDGGRDSVHAAHVDGPAALFAACEAAGLRRVIHISAVGAEADAGTAYAATKAEGEALLRARDLDWVILRPSLVIARSVYGGTALLRTLAGVPLVTPITQPDAMFQPVGVEELADTVAAFLAPDAPARVELAVAGPAPVSLAEIVRAYRRWLGFGPTRFVRVPRALEAILYALGDALGALGVRTPLRSTARAQMTFGVTADPSDWTRMTGVAPRSLDRIFLEAPATLQDRWHARMAFLKPVLIAVFGAYWIVSGAVALGPGRQEATDILAPALGGLAAPALWVTAMADIVLGLWLWSGVRFRACLAAMGGLTLAYCAGVVAVAPSLLVDPAGAGIKTVLALLVVAVLWAVSAER